MLNSNIHRPKLLSFILGTEDFPLGGAILKERLAEHHNCHLFFAAFPYILKKKAFDTATPAFGVESSTFLQIHNINRKSQPAIRNTKASLNSELKTKWVTNGVYDKVLFKSWWFWRRKNPSICVLGFKFSLNRGNISSKKHQQIFLSILSKSSRKIHLICLLQHFWWMYCMLYDSLVKTNF